MKRFSCDQARDYLDSARAELDLFRQRIENFERTGSEEDAEHCDIRKQFLQEAVDALMEGMRVTKLERAKEILGEEFVFPFSDNSYVPYSESQLKLIQDENELDNRRKTVLVEFKSFDQRTMDELNEKALFEKIPDKKIKLPPLKAGWRLMQTDVFPQSAGTAGDGLELHRHQVELMRRFEKEKKLTENSVRHASPYEVLFFQYVKLSRLNRDPQLNQRGYNMLTDIQLDDGGVLYMVITDAPSASSVHLDIIPRHSRFSRIGCLAVIEPDQDAKPSKKLIDVAGI